MGCYQTKQLKQSIQSRYKQTIITQISKEEMLKNEILLLRSCLFEILNMKPYMKSLVSMQQDICLIKMKKRHEENLDEIISCYEQNVMQRAQQIIQILKQQEIQSETSILDLKKQTTLSTCKNIKSLNTNCNSVNESAIFTNQSYDIYEVLRYCIPICLENDFSLEPIETEDNENYVDLKHD